MAYCHQAGESILIIEERFDLALKENRNYE